MNTPARTSLNSGPARLISRCTGLILGALVLPLAGLWPLHAQPTVTTLGGGRLIPDGPDTGFSDGDTLQVSQFRTPFGCAVDPSGRVYVADRDNGALRRLDIAANRCRTLLNGLHQPVSVSLDKAGAAYVLTAGDGCIWKVDRGLATLFTSHLSAPTAMTYTDDGTGNGLFYVTQADGSVVRVDGQDGTVSERLLTGLQQPSGIAVLDNGFAAISEAGGHTVRICDLETGTMVQRIGTGQSGFADGPAGQARFNQPFHLAKAPGGSLIVADRANHRVRLIEPDGFVSTVYGVDSSLWGAPECLTCNPLVLPGWFDGSAEFAEAREPVGVAVGNDGTIYSTEVYYHLVRQVSGAAFQGGGDSGTTNQVVLPPTISPASGYYPMGQVITVSNPNASGFLSSAVYYTTDGSEPTTNSFRVPMNGQAGSFLWQEKQRDLSSLRVKAFLGAQSSVTVSGESVAQTEIGVPQDIAAGIGSLVMVPVIVNLKTNEQLQSLQFRVEVAPASPGAPMIDETFQAVPVSTNDFIPLFTRESKGKAVFGMMPYVSGSARGLVISFIGTNANLVLKDFGTAALLALPIPRTARAGDRYTMEILNPSGTADASEQRIPMASMPTRSVLVQDVHYQVGDSSPAIWYNAAQLDPTGSARRGFGDGLLDNSDVNNAFAASMGLRVPFPNSDLFDAMDVFPEDTTTAVGGDGMIRYLDWQIVLLRSLGLEFGGWERTWSDGGIRVPNSSSSSAAGSMPGQSLAVPLPGAVWTPQVMLMAGQQESVSPGATRDIPITVQVSTGCQLAGLAFRASVLPEGASPSLTRAVQFIPNPNLPAPTQTLVPSPETVVCGWPLVPASSFDPPLQSTVLLGYVRVTVPVTSRSGDTYTLRFPKADGSPDLQTQYDFETRPGSLWVLSAAAHSPDPISDEWKLHFFGSLTSDAARPEADPDHDGVPNSAEYLAGTNPSDARSYLHLQSAQVDLTAHALVLRWLSAPGKRYRLESAPNLVSTQWSVLADGLVGDGTIQQWIVPNLNAAASFYRICLQP